MHPDIVALQESDLSRFSGGNTDLAGAMARDLGMFACFGPRTVSGTFGLTLLSRYPFRSTRTFFMSGPGEQTAAIEAHIVLFGTDTTILVTHLGNDGPSIQLRQVLEQVKGKSNAIVMGDFNFDRTSPQYREALEVLEDAWVQAGSPATPGLDADRLLDHIFISPGLEARFAAYEATPTSDHPLLLAELEPVF
jgi:endonuclease/exonuclease/phosphatase family metal-dependent hydrolase